MTEEPVAEAWSWLEARARTWFRDPAGADRLEIDGLPAGDALHVEAFDLLLALAPRLGVRLRAPGNTRLRFLKRLGVDRAARSWGLRVGNLGRRAANPAPILFVSEMATPSTLDPARCVADALPAPSYAVAAADPRAARFWTATGRRPVPLLVGTRQQGRILARARRGAARVWRDLERMPPRIEFGGTDLTGEAMGFLRPLVLRSLPWLHVEHAALRRAVEAIEPRWVVVATDQHRIGRLAAHLRSAGGYRLYVLQHGLPDDEIGYAPVVADRVAVWSEASRDWFLRRGTPADRLPVLGNPRHDALDPADRVAHTARVSREYGLSGRPRVLLAMSGIADDATERVTDLVLGALQRLPDASLIIKLHPGGGEGGAVQRAIRDLGAAAGQVRVVRNAPLRPLLHWADAVVVHRSSVVLDALLAGTPAVAPRLGGPPGHDNAADLPIPQAADADELARAITDLMGETARAGLFDAIRADLERVAGPSDGASAARIAADLLRPWDGPERPGHRAAGTRPPR